MTQHLSLVSRNNAYESKRFGLTCTELVFCVNEPVNTLQWPLEFSESIVSHIKEGIDPNDYIGISLKHCKAQVESNLPFQLAFKVNHTSIDEMIRHSFRKTDHLCGCLLFSVSKVKIPSSF